MSKSEIENTITALDKQLTDLKLREEQINIEKDALREINKKIALVVGESKPEKGLKSEPLKDSFLLFFAVILGAIGTELLNVYFIDHNNLLSLAISIPYILIASFVGGYFTYFVVFILPKWLKRIRS
jgi:hypothetical protein